MATQMRVTGSTGHEKLAPGSVLETVTRPILKNAPLWWWLGFVVSLILLAFFIFTLGSIVTIGVGVWDINNPVVWAPDIINLIFWIGIGHAGTFISAFLLLMRQHWRSAFSRFAEGVTLFALAVAALFPILHVGRPWFVYWLAPYPNPLGLNPQWTSPLVWDFVAINTYLIISLLFWYMDLLPDLASVRDKAQNSLTRFIYGAAAMGWRGDSAHWERLQKASYLLAALATPLVISVHSIIGLDFAISNVPGWHHTIFPPYFVGGAIFSGFAMVVLVALLLRSGFGMQKLITENHMDNAAKFMLATGLIVAYGYAVEVFGAWYTGHIGEVLVTIERATGPYGTLYWLMIFFNNILIQLLWFKRVRRNVTLLAIISVGVLIGMWLERFIIIAVSLAYNHSVSMWEQWHPTIYDVLTIISPFGLFLTLLFLFIRFVPVLPMYEVQQIDHQEGWE